jgi:3-oxoacid CoA-transferase subunit B
MVLIETASGVTIEEVKGKTEGSFTVADSLLPNK